MAEIPTLEAVLDSLARPVPENPPAGTWWEWRGRRWAFDGVAFVRGDCPPVASVGERGWYHTCAVAWDGVGLDRIRATLDRIVVRGGPPILGRLPPDYEAAWSAARPGLAHHRPTAWRRASGRVVGIASRFLPLMTGPMTQYGPTDPILIRDDAGDLRAVVMPLRTTFPEVTP